MATPSGSQRENEGTSARQSRLSMGSGAGWPTHPGRDLPIECSTPLWWLNTLQDLLTMWMVASQAGPPSIMRPTLTPLPTAFAPCPWPIDGWAHARDMHSTPSSIREVSGLIGAAHDSVREALMELDKAKAKETPRPAPAPELLFGKGKVSAECHGPCAREVQGRRCGGRRRNGRERHSRCGGPGGSIWCPPGEPGCLRASPARCLQELHRQVGVHELAELIQNEFAKLMHAHAASTVPSCVPF